MRCKDKNKLTNHQNYFSMGTKKGRGRPHLQYDTITLSIRLDEELYVWIRANKGRKSINQYINDVIRERKER